MMMSRPTIGAAMAQQLRRSAQLAFDNDRRPTTNGYTAKIRVDQKYEIIGFISSGTYGRVYKAMSKTKGELPSPTGGKPTAELFAIKKFKPEKEGDNIQYTGLSQSAIREMGLCTELEHPNLVHLVEIILQDKCVFMVFEYCEHDLLQIIHHHTQPTRHAIPATMIKSILFQLLNGLLYLHRNWVIHRDLKPANIMVTSAGAVRIGDLGLARIFHKPLASLYSGDKVVVTIWYRSPDLLLGAKHYTPAIDLWAVGCIFAELLSLRPIFKGEETKMDSKKTVPFQRNQMSKIVEILGMPRRDAWPGLINMPEFAQLQSLVLGRGPATMYPPPPSNPLSHGHGHGNRQSHSHSHSSNSHHHHAAPAHPTPSHSGLETWYYNTLRSQSYPPDPPTPQPPSLKNPGALGYALLSALLEYDPEARLTAETALQHDFFVNRDENGGHQGQVWVSGNCFEGLDEVYPARRVSTESNDIGTASLPGTKRGVPPDDGVMGGRDTGVGVAGSRVGTGAASGVGMGMSTGMGMGVGSKRRG